MPQMSTKQAVQAYAIPKPTQLSKLSQSPADVLKRGILRPMPRLTREHYLRASKFCQLLVVVRLHGLHGSKMSKQLLCPLEESPAHLDYAARTQGPKRGTISVVSHGSRTAVFARIIATSQSHHFGWHGFANTVYSKFWIIHTHI